MNSKGQVKEDGTRVTMTLPMIIAFSSELM